MSTAADSIADVLEALAERSVFWKGEVRRLEHQNEALWGASEANQERAQKLESEVGDLRRKLTKAEHQRGCARDFLHFIRNELRKHRDDAENGRIEGGESILECLKFCEDGLTRSEPESAAEVKGGKAS